MPVVSRGKIAFVAVLGVDAPPHLLPPGLVDPVDDRESEVLLALELVVERAAGVARLAGDLLEHDVAVPVVGETTRSRLEQGTA